MLRSIKSGQRKVRVIALGIDHSADELSGPDEKSATASSGVITFNQKFEQKPVVIAQPSSALTSVAADGSSVTVSADCDLIIVGSDTSEKY